MCQKCNCNCNCNGSLQEQINNINSPITGEVIGDKITLIRDNEVIGEIPIVSVGELDIIDAFGDVIPD